MSDCAVVSPRVLVTEPDLALGLTLHQALAGMGYTSTLASSLDQGLRWLHEQPFDLIVTDTFSGIGQQSLANLRPLLALAYPIPVILCSAWDFEETAVTQAGFAGQVKQPFDLDELITTVAECLNCPWSPVTLHQAEVARRYISALKTWDVEALVALCTEDVQLFPEIVPAYPHAHAVRGRAAARAYYEQQQHYFLAYQLDLSTVYPCPHGVAGRLLIEWQDPPGVVHQQMIAGCIKMK
jgi:CheY-like chemotaxis protein